MSRYRRALPQLSDRLFATDGGLETTLIFHDGIELRQFASFELLKTDPGRERLARYFRTYADIARGRGLGLVLESATWRASRDWGAKLGYDDDALRAINREAIAQLVAIRDAYDRPETPAVISGNIGPRGDGYNPSKRMSAEEARAYHGEQVATFADTEADMVAAFTMNYTDEAIGIVTAAKEHDLPVVISFTLETDGSLPSGESLADAIARTDARTDGHAAYYMVNCAHPTHFDRVLDGDWVQRIRGVRANASRRSHKELDESPDLDAGDPAELGRQYRDLRQLLPTLAVVGGCCGTDHRHVQAICDSLTARAAR